MSAPRPLCLTIAALGGQGGGVLTEWLVDAARRSGYRAQATSVPGVAQRTGATIYYLEFLAETVVSPDGRAPIFALMPAAGDVDIVLAAELVEAGRMVERGLVTADRTTLIASTHRAYTVAEKSQPGDGRIDPAVVLDGLRLAAKRLIAFDMEALAQQYRGVVSPVLFGALCGSGTLPFDVEHCREAIRRYGLAVEGNLLAFEAALQLAAAGVPPVPPVPAVAPIALPSLPDGVRAQLTGFPAAVHAVVVHGAARCIEYQDAAYAELYVQRLQSVAAAESAAVLPVVARTLALWMCFEDPIRVAALKLAPGRVAEIRRHVRAKPGEIVQVREFMHPRVEELAGLLPNAWGRKVLASRGLRHWLRRFEKDRIVTSTSIRGYLLLRALSALRPWRRGMLRYVEENRRLLHWLEAVVAAAAAGRTELAVELAECQSLVRGYGETIERGHHRLQKVLALSSRAAAYTAPNVRQLRLAAEHDGDGDGFELAWASITGAAATP